MFKRLKLKQISREPEQFIALEYESDQYLSYANVAEMPNVSWESSSLGTEAVIDLLRDRGWHPTDIGDQLAEARQYAGAAA